MLLGRTCATLGALVMAGGLAGGLAACGSSDSGGGAAGAPTDASTSAFCHTFSGLGAGSTPRTIADKLAKVGTPSDIDARARDGFEVLLGKLQKLPESTRYTTATRMAAGLSASDKADVLSFVKYLADECQDLPTAPSS